MDFESKIIFQHCKFIFSGIAQVILQPCYITGAICLFAIAINSWELALGGLLGSMIGTATAILLKLKPNEIQLGLYGFNATLIGIANVYLFEISFISIIVLVASCALSVIAAQLITLLLKLPPYTAPFVLITWLIILFSSDLRLLQNTITPGTSYSFHSAGIFEGIGQVFLQGNALSGAVIVLAVLYCSKSSFAWAVLATLISYLIAVSLSYKMDDIVFGLYGFNAVLTAIALEQFKRILLQLIGITLTVIVTHIFIISEWPSFTAPFVIITWLITIIYTRYSKINF